MRNKLYIPGLTFLLFSCGHLDTKRAENTILEDSTAFYSFDLEKALLSNELPQSFVINKWVKNAEFYSFDADKRILLKDYNIRATRLGDTIVISSGIFNASTPVSLFDTKGRHINDIVYLGRGSNEVTSISSWSINDSLNAISVFGGYKIVFHSFKTHKSKEINLSNYTPTGVLLNDGHYVTISSRTGSGTIDDPFLYFVDDKGQIVESVCYGQPRNISYPVMEGQSSFPLESYGLYEGIRNGALFRDMFNDTIYSIMKCPMVRPYMSLYRGKLSPKVEDANDSRKKARTVYIRDIMESEGYFIIKYIYENSAHTALLEKESGNVVSVATCGFDNIFVNYPAFARYETPVGDTILVGIAGIHNGEIYCVIRADDAMKFMPGIDEESNPVLMTASFE